MSGLLETDIDGRLMSIAFRFPRRGASRARPLECSVYEGREIRRYAPQLSSGGSSPGPGSRMSVSWNSVMVITPGAGSWTTSTIVVSATGVLGRFTGLAFLRVTFFGLGLLALATTFFGLNLLEVRLAVLPRTDLEDLRTLSRPVDFLFRPVTRFLR